jgi:ABC-type Fe3+-hydroxamate transport system substrate-binding protein
LNALFFSRNDLGGENGVSVFLYLSFLYKTTALAAERMHLAVALVALAAALALGGTACQKKPADSPDAAETRQVTDDIGRTVNLPVTITRAVSLAPSLTEMIFAVGAGDRLVGVTTYCNYPPETAAIRKVGDTQTPNIEAIIALRPEVVFVSTASQLEAFTRTLEDRKIAVYVTDPKNLDDVFRDLATFGDLFGTREQAGILVNGLVERVQAVKEEAGQRPPVRVFVQISRDPLYTIGKDSFLTEVVTAAGGDPLTKDIATAYPTISKETASAMDPEVIILSDSADNREPNDVFKRSDAVKNGHVLRINADIISRPGPRLVDALEEIAEYLKNSRSS